MNKTFAFLTATAFAVALAAPAFAQSGTTAGGTDKPAVTSGSAPAESSGTTQATSEKAEKAASEAGAPSTGGEKTVAKHHRKHHKKGSMKKESSEEKSEQMPEGSSKAEAPNVADSVGK
jgi:hypothetical protein